MKRSTFDPAGVRADSDYALPHAADLSGDLRPIPLAAEHDVLPSEKAVRDVDGCSVRMAQWLRTLSRCGAPGLR
jgi:hypothetical protein